MDADFDFTDFFLDDNTTGTDMYTAPAGSIDAKIRDERDYQRHVEAESRKRGAYAAARDADRVKYTLSLEDANDDADGRDVLRQTILTVPHVDLINALDLARTMRAEIKGLKKGKLIDTAEMMSRYARYMYGLARGIGDVRGKPSDDPYWRTLERVHSLVDGYIYKGEGRDDLVAAINSLPERIDVIFLRDKPSVRDDFDIDDADHRQLPTGIMSAVDENATRNSIGGVNGVDLEAIVADVVRRTVKTMEETFRKGDDAAKQTMASHLMPDLVTRVLDRVRTVAAKSNDNVTDIVERSAIRVPAGEADISTQPIRRVPRAKKSTKRGRDEDEGEQ